MVSKTADARRRIKNNRVNKVYIHRRRSNNTLLIFMHRFRCMPLGENNFTRTMKLARIFVALSLSIYVDERRWRLVSLSLGEDDAKRTSTLLNVRENRLSMVQFAPR